MIRHARPADHPAIAAVVEAAFGRADEVRLVQRLRDDAEVMFELVEDEDGAIVGHILFSRLWADSLHLYAALAPLAVTPERQRTGLGARLVKAGLETCREFGAQAVLVLGDPAYYGRFGFSAAAAAKVKAPYSALPAFQALALERGGLDHAVTVAYPSAFDA